VAQAPLQAGQDPEFGWWWESHLRPQRNARRHADSSHCPWKGALTYLYLCPFVFSCRPKLVELFFRCCPAQTKKSFLVLSGSRPQNAKIEYYNDASTAACPVRQLSYIST